MAKIFQLNDHLSNKIAAGEVVERPASVVKELVENAIDANSRVIRVDVEEGGLTSIRVLDDGDGIESDDLETAFDRHATSKIKYDQDLFRIKTLGFRGEALPSIASVSKLLIKTSTGHQEGYEMALEGGRITHRNSTAPRKGTEVVVSDLFFNTPARLKYLKTIHTELGHISDVLNRMALSHPDVSFILTHNEKMLLQTMGNGDLKRVIAAIYGSSVAKKLIEVSAESLDFTVKGFIAKPEITRSNRSYMSTILNGRYVRNYPLMKSIQQGYHTLLPIGKFPLAVLHIDMNPILLDVNVHPSKLEVRISKEAQLQELVATMIQDAFKQVQLIPDMSKPARVSHPKTEQVPFVFEHDIKGQEVMPAEEKIEGRSLIDDDQTDMDTAMTIHETPASRHDTGITDTRYIIPDESVEEKQAGHLTDNEEGNEEKSSESLLSPVNEATDNTSAADVPVLYPIGQLHGTYILAQNDQGLYMIDQHAAQERIKYEYFRDKLTDADTRVQDLLVPLTFEMTAAEEALINEHHHVLEQVGLFLEPFGTKTYIVRSCPVWFPEGQEEEIIADMLEQLKNERTIQIGKLREEAAILMSCKAAIKANRHLTKDEMFQLLETLRTCHEPYTCPHGRPIIIHYSTYEIERLFKRIM
ncbi:DNA mismatch repair endonuclease MutL [Salipaludibacillus agaradhaerens]|uniref:DNA mismatch repair endonuclease MutL n=1 Tax=Salipaludibacillus agaradhaerens TaxID=76935 RepID=UPI000996D174|nr:DNA mismatch repair endonuclease MutL [Salipaludibacillus agaradhaerens]